MADTRAELRYGFGENWAEFIEKNFNESMVEQSQQKLAEFLRVDSLKGQTFLDIGCGSGLHSLAAHRLGAEQIISFDYDLDSVATTQQLRHYAGDPENWKVMQGSVLDPVFIDRLPPADIVYSWGVLHHTGDMWTAVRNAAGKMKAGGVFFIALYASEIYVDPPPEYWIKVKRRYNRVGQFGKRIMEWLYVARFQIAPAVKAGKNPISAIRDYGHRGMNFWTDVKDWLGGYPIEFCTLQETQQFCADELGLNLVNVKTGEGCSEYLFCRLDENELWRRISDTRRQLPLQTPFRPQGGASFHAALPGLVDQADSSMHQRRSRLMVYEDGQILGFSHALHAHIAQLGHGRFSHWNGELYFSASDNSDPNSNGRRYTYCESF